MDALHPLGHSRRPVAERVLLVFRTRPTAAARLCAGASARPKVAADGSEAAAPAPFLRGGYALLLLAYTRLTRTEPRWLPHGRPAGTHHLTYHVPLAPGVRLPGDGPRRDRAGSLLLRHESSAWFGAHWAARLRREARIRSRFEVSGDALTFDLRVRRPDAPPLSLRTAHAPDWPRGLFHTRREFEEFLGTLEPARLNGTLRPATDELLEEPLCAEPLEVLACEAALPFEGLAADEVTLDCAVRMRPRILAPVVDGARLVREVPEASSAAPAL